MSLNNKIPNGKHKILNELKLTQMANINFEVGQIYFSPHTKGFYIVSELRENPCVRKCDINGVIDAEWGEQCEADGDLVERYAFDLVTPENRNIYAQKGEILQVLDNAHSAIWNMVHKYDRKDLIPILKQIRAIQP